MSRKTHGDSSTRLYQIWHDMMQRCFNENCKRYPRYGGRDIYVEDSSWFDFVAFREWALANGYRDDLTIDRIDNNKGYYSENCRWIPLSENSKKDKGQRVNQYDLDGNFIATYPSVREAERQTNTCHSVSGACLGKSKQAGGYRWSYAT